MRSHRKEVVEKINRQTGEEKGTLIADSPMPTNRFRKISKSVRTASGNDQEIRVRRKGANAPKLALSPFH